MLVRAKNTPLFHLLPIPFSARPIAEMLPYGRLRSALAQQIASALPALLPVLPSLPLSVPSVQPSSRLEFGDFQSVLFPLAQSAKRPPAQLALALAATITEANKLQHPQVCSAVAMGGYINFTLSLEQLQHLVNLALDDAEMGGVAKVQQRQRWEGDKIIYNHNVVVDYASPNIAKEMHVVCVVFIIFILKFTINFYL